MDWESAEIASDMMFQEISKFRQSRIPSILLGINQLLFFLVSSATLRED